MLNIVLKEIVLFLVREMFSVEFEFSFSQSLFSTLCSSPLVETICIVNELFLKTLLQV